MNDLEHSPLTLQNEIVKVKTLDRKVNNINEALPENKLLELDGLEEDKENIMPNGLTSTWEANNVKINGIRSFSTSCRQDLENQLAVRLLDLEKAVASQAMEKPVETKVVVASHVCVDKENSDNSAIENAQLVRTIDRLDHTLKQRKRRDAEAEIEKMGQKGKYLDSHGLLEVRPLGKVVANQEPAERVQSEISKEKILVHKGDSSGVAPPDNRQPRPVRMEMDEENALKASERPDAIGGKGAKAEKVAQKGKDFDIPEKLAKKTGPDRKLAKNMATSYHHNTNTNSPKVKVKSNHVHKASNSQTSTGKPETKGNPKWIFPNEKNQQLMATPPPPPSQQEIKWTPLMDNLEGNAYRQSWSPIHAMQSQPLSPYSNGQRVTKPADTVEAGDYFSARSPLLQIPPRGGQIQPSPCDKTSKNWCDGEQIEVGNGKLVTKCGGRQTAMQMTQFDPPCDILKQMHCPSSIVLPRRIADGPNHPSSSPPPTTQVTTKQPQLLQLAEQQ
ncbi:hypothetical protein RFI_02620, partial [Reticulomyxa filosa]